MTAPAAAAETTARASLLGLLLLQPIWHGWLHPAQLLSPWVVVAVTVLPLLLVGIAVVRHRPGALFLAGLLALPYFCHGVAEAWSDPGARILAMLEVLLSLLLVGAIAVAGRQHRRAAAGRSGPARAG